MFDPTAKRCRGGRPFSAGYVRDRALGAQPPTANWTCAVAVGSVQTVIARHRAAVRAICQDVGIVAVTATSVHLERTAAMAPGEKTVSRTAGGVITGNETIARHVRERHAVLKITGRVSWSRIYTNMVGNR